MSNIARLEKDKRRAEHKNNLKEVASLANLLGQELQQAGDYEGALVQHREEAALCEALGDTIGVAVAHRRMGEVYSEMSEWGKALHHQNKHLSLAKEAESLVEEQRAYATLGRTHLQKAEEAGLRGQEEEQTKALTEAEKAFLRSLSVCERLKGAVDSQEHSQMRCRLYLNLGLVLDYRGNVKKAQHFISQALDLCTSHSLYEDAQRCHSALGVILLREGLLTDALQEGQKSLALAAKLHNKSLQCDCHSFLAQVHLANTDYEAAKKCYHKAYKLKHPDLEDRERIEKNLKSVVSMCAAEDSLVMMGDGSDEEKIKLYEKLGDGSAHLGFYSKAIEYYQKMLECAVLVNKSPSFLAPIYLSLAQTYSDNKQFLEAKEYYIKEYEVKLQEDASEACKTLLTIADVRERLGENYDTLSDTYQEARALAVKDHNPKLEIYVLRLYSCLPGIPEDIKCEIKEQMNRLADQNALDPEAELSDEEENECEEEIDLDLINFSDSEDDQENFDRPRQSRQKKSRVVKRNEKGETPLHKACIDGNLTMVRKLLQQGHPVNPRDNCGWLPIHEAANHGYYDIVLELIEAGAWVSDRGGKQCDGITPIHDAASCGNIEVVRLLMNRGASVIAKTDDGDTPLESLVNYRRRAKLSKRDEEECIRLETELKEAMKRAGHKIPAKAVDSTQPDRFSPKESQPLKRRASSMASLSGIEEKSRPRKSSEEKFDVKSKMSSRKGFEQESEDLNDDLPDLCISGSNDYERPASACSQGNPTEADIEEDSEEFFNPLLIDLQEKEKSATGTYLSAIESVGSALRRTEFQKSSLSLSKDKKQALVTDEDVGDDWLDDDLGIFSRKRKRVEKLEFEYKEPKRERRVLSEKNSSERLLSRSKKVRQTKLTSIVQKYPEDISDGRNSPCRENDYSFSDSRDSPVTTETNRAVDSPSTSNHESPITPSSTQGSISGGALRLRVRVQNRVLLVPVAGAGQNRTVSWLAEEVTRRYYQLAGLRPHLTLTTQDGAVLDPNDPISLVLPMEMSELQAQVTGWDLPPLPDRYSQACQALGTVPVSSISSILHRTEASTSLDLKHVRRITTLQLQPVLRAIQCQQSLRSIDLSHCRLGDDGFRHLIEALQSLPSLEALHLRAAAVTTSSFVQLTEAITSGEVPLKSLTSLDMSYNTLSGVKLSHIGTILSLPLLTSLKLKHCSMSLIGQQQLPAISSGLKTLSLDYNIINSVSLANLLSCVPQVSNLTLSGVRSNQEGKADSSARLGVALSGVLGAGEQCLLQQLDLSSCNLSDADLEDISAYLYRCPFLTSINLAHNPDISSSSINALLDELTTNLVLPLTDLSIHGNKSFPLQLTAKIATTLRHKAATKYPVKKLSISNTDSSSQLEDLWRAQHQKKASVNKISGELFLESVDS
ncbi:tonsoku-like protein [Penaeus japonicus]|uniref:tonsoku-like protein n=1 Tax=Penaeus japonicus TaxID=27405 RepID=UPI001C70DA0D|nr:tonsoku-like protein [Penaeus japonicus]